MYTPVYVRANREIKKCTAVAVAAGQRGPAQRATGETRNRAAGLELSVTDGGWGSERGGWGE